MDIIKIVSDIVPLGVFFLAYKYTGLMGATFWLVGTTCLMTLILFLMKRKLPVMPLASSGLLLLFGSITLISGDLTFIKMKPTIINLAFAIVLFGGALMKKGLIRHVMGSGLVLSDKAWVAFSLRWAYFFTFLACTNEYVWRNYSEAQWVQFKVFGMLGLTILFLFTQMFFIVKNVPPQKSQ